VDQAPARKPYDAPNWLSALAPVKLSDLNGGSRKLVDQPDVDQLNAEFNLQIPPALYSGNSKGIPLHLDYSYANQISNKDSVLSVFYQSQFIKSLTLPMPWEWTSKVSSGIQFMAIRMGLTKESNPLLTKRSTVYIPQPMIYPSSAAGLNLITDHGDLAPFLRMDFAQAAKYQGECPILEDRGSFETKINSNSTIDISGMPHFIAMPNLAAFRVSGFPFSRLADLAETAVILPDDPNLNDYSAYLAILARIGRLTGYPGTSVTVASANQLNTVKNKDLLVIASGSENQTLLKQWESNIPESNNSIFTKSIDINNIKNWFSKTPDFDIYQNTFIAGFQSPLDSKRSVVLLASVDSESLTNLTNSLDGSAGRITGALVRLNEGKIELVSDKQTYHAGSLSWFEYISWLISEYLALFISISVIGAVIPALFIYAALIAKRKNRLIL
jgi:hypothetical protein